MRIFEDVRSVFDRDPAARNVFEILNLLLRGSGCDYLSLNPFIMEL